jgi:hypothetical protein
MAETGLLGPDLIGKLQDADIIPKKLMIRSASLHMEIDNVVIFNLECILPASDAKIILDSIIAGKCAERMKSE